VIKRFYSSSIEVDPARETPGVAQDIKNGFYWLDSTDLQQLTKALSLMKQTMIYSDAKDEIYFIKGLGNVSTLHDYV